MSLGRSPNRRYLDVAAAIGVGGLTVITEFLLEHKWLSPAALVVLVVLGPIMGSQLVSRTDLAKWLAALCLVPIALVTLAPQDRELFSRCEIQ